MKITPKDILIWLLERGVFIVFLILLVVGLMYVVTLPETYGVNKTVGWAWDITNMRYWYGITWFIYFNGFLLLLLMRRPVNKYFSAAFLLLLTATLLSFYYGFEAKYYLAIVTFIVFAVLFFQALFKPKPKRRL